MQGRIIYGGTSHLNARLQKSPSKNAIMRKIQHVQTIKRRTTLQRHACTSLVWGRIRTSPQTMQNINTSKSRPTFGVISLKSIANHQSYTPGQHLANAFRESMMMMMMMMMMFHGTVHSYSPGHQVTTLPTVTASYGFRLRTPCLLIDYDHIKTSWTRLHRQHNIILNNYRHPATSSLNTCYMRDYGLLLSARAPCVKVTSLWKRRQVEWHSWIVMFAFAVA